MGAVSPGPTSNGGHYALTVKPERLSTSGARARARANGLVSSILLISMLCTLSALVMLHQYQGAGPAPVQLQTEKASRQAVQLTRTRLSARQLQEGIKQQHPLNRLQCGNWMEQYAQLHHDILAGVAPQRYAVMRSKQEFGNGLADRLATSVTIFLYALLTNRAFQYDWDPLPDNYTKQIEMQEKEYGRYMYFEPSTHLWEGLRSEFIDWRYTGNDRGNLSVVMDYNCDKDTDVYKALFTETDVTKLHDDKHTVIWHADHAMIYAAFDNPYLKDKLAALGLQRETAFACMFDFLYRPTPDVMALFRPELTELLDPDALKIGVQIRVGDWQLCDSYTFKPQHYPSLFDHYFQCAKEIEEELALPGQKVVYYTLTDIPDLRQRLAHRHATRILINTGVSVEHIVKTKNNSRQGFLQAVGELYAFSLTSAHVITRKSGFGKVPAMVNANGTNHIFTIDYPMRFMGLMGLDNRKNLGLFRRKRCTTKNATPLSQVCTDFTGI